MSPTTANTTPALLSYGAASYFTNVEEAKRNYDVLAKHEQVNLIDTARFYGDSEKFIGELGLSSKYAITTKAPTMENIAYAGDKLGHADEVILEAAKESLNLLQVDKVALYLLHSPETSTPFEKQLEAVQKLYLEGKFERFGVSNFTSAQVREIHSIASAKGYVLPTVYQGSYSLLFRNIEESLFPTLRELNISFQAYSPLGGGFFVKTPEFIRNPPSDGKRWDRNTMSGKMYALSYNRPKLLKYLEEYIELARETGLGKVEIAYRWARYHSILDGEKGDVLIFGPNGPEQLEETLRVLEKGPLGDDVVGRLEAMWEKVKDEAPDHDTMLQGALSQTSF